jgi:hypothetical protein
MAAFDYPPVAHQRRHGPQGYKRAIRRWRSMWIRIVELAEMYDHEHFKRIMGFPDDLPKLNQSPPVNTRPEGVRRSWYAKRQRGELPEVY